MKWDVRVWAICLWGPAKRKSPLEQIAQTLTVDEFYKPIEENEESSEESRETEPTQLEPDEDGKYPANLHLNDSIEIALRKFDHSGKEKLPVIIDKHNHQILGHATHLDALNAYNKSLIHAHEEEHK